MLPDSEQQLNATFSCFRSLQIQTSLCRLWPNAPEHLLIPWWKQTSLRYRFSIAEPTSEPTATVTETLNLGWVLHEF